MLIPREHQSQRQIIDRTAKSLGQGQCHPDGAVSIVALPHIHQPRQSIDGAQVQIIEPVFATGQCEDQGVWRRLLDELGIVVPARPGAITAAHQKDVADSTAADGLYHLICHREHCIVAKTGGQLAAAVDAGKKSVLLEASQSQGFFNDRAKILVGPDVVQARVIHHSGGKSPVLVRGFGGHQAVGGK